MPNVLEQALYDRRGGALAGLVHHRARGTQYLIAMLAWVESFNARRLLEPIGYVPPADCEARYYEQVKVEEVLAVSHCVPLHLGPMGRRYGYQTGDLPVTESVSEQLVRLPFYASLTPKDQARVVGASLRLDPQAMAGHVYG